MGARLISALIGFLGLLLYPIPYLIGQFLARTAVEAGQDEFACLEQARLLLGFQRRKRLDDHRFGIGVPATLDPILEFGRGLQGAA